jgi:hypothetical protein
MSDTAQTGASTPNLFSFPTTTLVRKAARWLGLCRLYSSANKQQAGPVVGVFSSARRRSTLLRYHMNPQIALPVDVRPEEVVRKHPLGGAIEPCVGDGGMNAVCSTATDTESHAERLKVSPSQQKVLDVLIVKRRHGVHEVTAGEVREMLEQLHSPRRFDKGWATGRLDELKDLGLVEQSEERRMNPMTGRSSLLWFIPASQALLFS